MENKDRREFIKLAGTALLVTSGISVIGLVTAVAKPAANQKGDYFADGYYDDGYYDDGYYEDGYYDDGYYDDGYVGLGEIKRESLQLVVMPNPSDGAFELTINAKTAEHSTILINDISGKTLVQKNHLLQQGVNRLPFESGVLARGVYELRVITEKGAGSVRLVIVK